MKKSNLFLSLIAMFMAIFFSACTENPTNQLDSTKSSKNKTAKIAVWQNATVANPSNPFDWVGVQHNNTLELVANNRVEFTNNSVQSLNQYLPTDSKVPENFLNQYDASFAGGVENWIQQLPLTQPAKERVSDLFQLFNSHKNDADVSALTEDIKNFETSIIEDQNIIQNDKEAILAATSIARYSVNYWYETFTDGNTPHVEWQQSENRSYLTATSLLGITATIGAIIVAVTDVGAGLNDIKHNNGLTNGTVGTAAGGASSSAAGKLITADVTILTDIGTALGRIWDFFFR